MPNETTDNQQVKSRRDEALERLSSRYPDKKFEDDEAIYGQMLDDYDANDKELSSLRDDTQRLADVFNKNPELADFMAEAVKGNNPVLTYIRKYGDNIREMLDDESKQEEFAAANKEYMDRVAKEQEYEDEYQKNLDESLSLFDQLEAEGMPSEKLDAAFAKLQEIVTNAVMGKFTREDIEMITKAIDHDSDVAAAEHEGMVAGRIQKVTEQLRKSRRGDGTAADLGGRNGGTGGGRRRDIDFNSRPRDIWSRGGEVRTPARR